MCPALCCIVTGFEWWWSPLPFGCMSGAVSSFCHVVERVCVPVISAWRKSCGVVCWRCDKCQLGSRKRCGRLCSPGFSSFGVILQTVAAAVTKSWHILALCVGGTARALLFSCLSVGTTSQDACCCSRRSV